MASQSDGPPTCPGCGSSKVALCGESVDYRPEEHPNQPLPERELHTLAYQCECGLAFTQTDAADQASNSGSDS
jgi:hypothetical protein